MTIIYTLIKLEKNYHLWHVSYLYYDVPNDQILDGILFA